MLKRIARWRGIRLAQCWAVLLVLYAALALNSHIQNRRFQTASWPIGLSPAQTDSLARQPPPSAARQESTTAFLYTLLQSPREMARFDSAVDRIRTAGRPMTPALRDSLWRAFKVPGALTPAQHDTLRASGRTLLNAAVPAVNSFGHAMRRVGFWLVVLTVALWAPAIVLAVLTVLWFVARDRYGSGPSDAAA